MGSNPTLSAIYRAKSPVKQRVLALDRKLAPSRTSARTWDLQEGFVAYGSRCADAGGFEGSLFCLLPGVGMQIRAHSFVSLQLRAELPDLPRGAASKVSPGTLASFCQRTDCVSLTPKSVSVTGF